ncbi:hypothetical protein GF339_18550 [candidate division KSB3 bacterium]|uniref:Rubrerythrin diiron-binding domain-containing protein n=1 Tax=candidate division KSB3 bacterium TaxID=2044937 RepID=A0A9D5JZE6_9BACT|nr:hypothetical protein [candidate division KSB3 bacterium]MBD3326591.1 hypothetical protein [candidate division KSB3 bacterium]
METFDVRQIVTLATKIEENGYRFYTYMAERLDNDAVKKLFAFLADEERNHRRTFEGMLAKLRDRKPVETLPTEYFEYLQTYTDSSIFQQEMSTQEMEQFADVPAALKYSIDREADSILYYHEIKNFLPDSEHRIIDTIIEEERRHYVKLSELAKTMTTS